MGVMRNWVAPASATAVVAWIVIPLAPPESDFYERSVSGEHRACALERVIKPRQGYSYSPEAFESLIPTLNGSLRVVEGHECGQQADLTHVILEDRAGTRASVFVTRSPESSERRFGRRRVGHFEVSQVRTTRHRAFVVIDPQRTRQLRAWRELTLDRLEHFLKQQEGS